MRNVLLLALVLALGACAQGRYLTPQEAAQYCATNGPGAALGMNPLGEDYATYMYYCHPQHMAQTLPALALAANTIQTQQALDQRLVGAPAYQTWQPTLHPTLTRCVQQGVWLNCTSRP